MMQAEEQIAGFYFCHCPDMQMAKEHMEENYIPAFGDAWIHAERRTFWTEDIINNSFFSALDTNSFETKNKIFYIRDSHELSAENWKKISQALGRPRTDVFPVFFIHNALEKGKLKIPAVLQKQKCFEFAQKKGWVFESVGITEGNFAAILKKQAAAKFNLNLANDVINILKEILSPDFNSINNVLAQLSLFAEQGEVTSAVVSQLTNYTPELGLFDIIKKIETGNAKEVWKTLLKDGRQPDETVIFPFIAVMMREMRTLWKLKANEQVFLPSGQIANKTNIANKLGFTYISKIISLLCFAEYAVKSGKKSPLETFEELIKDICKIYQKDYSELAALYSVSDNGQASR